MANINKAEPDGGNMIINPNSSLFRSSDYVVLSNENYAPIYTCPLFDTTKIQCDLPIQEQKSIHRKCHGCINKNDLLAQNTKIINNQVRLSSSHHMNNNTAASYLEKKNSITKKCVPTRGNSTKSSITKLRPGSTSALGSGVHVKHGSYQRRLLKLRKNCIC
jgi:hypothetical protein